MLPLKLKQFHSLLLSVPYACFAHIYQPILLLSLGDDIYLEALCVCRRYHLYQVMLILACALICQNNAGFGEVKLVYTRMFRLSCAKIQMFSSFRVSSNLAGTYSDRWTIFFNTASALLSCGYKSSFNNAQRIPFC